ncbi:hypothetical protein Tco_0872527 [Tanacetum coccineum]
MNQEPFFSCSLVSTSLKTFPSPSLAWLEHSFAVVFILVEYHKEVLESGEGSIYKGGDTVVGGVGLGLKGDDKVLGLELKVASKVVYHGGGWLLAGYYNTLLESLNLTAPPLQRDPSCLEGDVRFVELFEYEIGDFSEEEIEEEEDVVEVEELGLEYFNKFLTRNELAYHKYLLYDPIHLALGDAQSS